MRRVFGESEAGGGGQSNQEIVSFGFVRATMRARGFGAILKRDSSLSIYFSAAHGLSDFFPFPPSSH